MKNKSTILTVHQIMKRKIHAYKYICTDLPVLLSIDKTCVLLCLNNIYIHICKKYRSLSSNILFPWRVKPPQQMIADICATLNYYLHYTRNIKLTITCTFLFFFFSFFLYLTWVHNFLLFPPSIFVKIKHPERWQF